MAEIVRQSSALKGCDPEDAACDTIWWVEREGPDHVVWDEVVSDEDFTIVDEWDEQNTQAEGDVTLDADNGVTVSPATSSFLAGQLTDNLTYSRAEGGTTSFTLTMTPVAGGEDPLGCDPAFAMHGGCW